MFHPWRTRSRVKLETNRYNKKVPISPPTNGEGLSRCFSRPLLRTLWGEGEWTGRGGRRNIAATPRRQTAVNGGRKRRRGCKTRLETRESRQFSQLSDLHPCSSFTGRLLRGEGRKEGGSFGTLDGDHGWDPSRLLTRAQCSIFFARACVCVPLSTRTCFPLPPSRVGQVSRRANRLKVRSPGFEWDDFCEKSLDPSVPRDLMRRLPWGWKPWYPRGMLDE